MLSPQSSPYRSYLSKKVEDNREKCDLEYLSQFSLRFIGDIHRFDMLLRRVTSNNP
jgi:hypothetical protein